ncbi:MAG: UDP-glucose 4-epimerase GalE [Christensenellaceae bacterium]|jgi:UDP-glucose 4-epimerase|nr:UDP-glucose 4-epimerase GalE [Christensenellaceae bacterium]
MQQRILVLGGAGYIGSHTVYALVESGAQVVVADNLETGHRAALHPEAKFYQGDIRDGAFLDNLFTHEKVEGVIHFAANSLVGESMENPLKYYDNNVGGTRVLLSAMLRHGVKHIVFSSTAATYGEPAQIPILESDPARPTNAYGETKLAMERMFHWTEQAHGLKYASLRYFNASGAHPHGAIGEAHAPETHLVPLILQAALGKRASIQIYGDDYPTRDGTCVRDYIHVCDLADAHILAINYLLAGNPSDIFNLGNGVGFTVKEVLTAAEQVVGHAIPRQTTARRAGDPAQLVASSEKARSILKWDPQRADIHRIIEDAWRWHAAHPDGFAD